jgi:MFS family permease
MQRVTRYRWVVLTVFSLLNLSIQLLWISYAPVASFSAQFYNVSELYIGFFAMSFMAAFIPFSIPASWVIDTKGFKFGVGIGAVLMGIFAPLRGLFGSHFAFAMACTVMLAIAQPFFLNAWTKCAALWFPKKERATAVGIVTLANLIGTGIGMAVTPLLIKSMTISHIQMGYGLVALVTSVLFFVFAKEKPAISPEEGESEVRSLMLDGLKSAFRNKSFVLYLGIMFVGMGLFNGITTWIEGIVKPRGLNAEQAGLLGAIMLGGGLLGAIVIPALSDRQKKRKKFLIMGLILGIPGVMGLAMAPDFTSIALCCAWLGFWLTSTLPIGMQYAAELTHPTPEGTSSGLIQLVGQGSVVFVFLMEAMKASDGSFMIPLIFGGLLLAVASVVSFFLVEPAVPFSSTAGST